MRLLQPQASSTALPSQSWPQAQAAMLPVLPLLAGELSLLAVSQQNTGTWRGPRTGQPSGSSTAGAALENPCAACARRLNPPRRAACQPTSALGCRWLSPLP